MKRRFGFFLLGAIALTLPDVSIAHEHTAPWLDEATLDRGLYVEVRHPRVIRRPGPFDVTVVVNNLGGPGDVALREVRYVLPGAFAPYRHPREDVLPSRRAAYRGYKSVQEAIHEAAERGDRPRVERLGARNERLLRTITSATRRDRQHVEASFVPEVGRTLSLAVEIDVVEPSGPRTLRRSIDILVAPPLPSGPDGSWLAGDQHLHTRYSIDAFFLNGTREGVSDYAHVAQTVGLDWIIVSDHSNVGFLVWYRPILFRLGEREAERVRNEEDYLVLQGQEMGAGANGRFGEPAHLLAYPREVDSMGYLPNPCSGLIFNHVNCEPEQVVLDRIHDHGGIAFIAHPFDVGPLSFAPWNIDGDATGWAGLEIFNSYRGAFADNDQESVDWWYELLKDIAPPHDGELAERPGFPTRFPVGLGNSDAHEPSQIGAVFSYCRMPEVTRGFAVPRADLMAALAAGRCVATNGPLVLGDVNGAGPGDVALVPSGENDLTVTLLTTPELGPVSDYEITVFVDGAARATVPLSSYSGFEATVVLDHLLFPPDTFVTLRAQSTTSGYVAIANPIWLEFPEATP